MHNFLEYKTRGVNSGRDHSLFYILVVFLSRNYTALIRYFENPKQTVHNEMGSTTSTNNSPRMKLKIYSNSEKNTKHKYTTLRYT